MTSVSCYGIRAHHGQLSLTGKDISLSLTAEGSHKTNLKKQLRCASVSNTSRGHVDSEERKGV